MKDYRKDFMDFGEKIWLNAASEGPLPRVSAEALNEAVIWKSLPYQLTNQRFVSSQIELKRSIAKLITVNEKDVILGNSASYGLHILANGIFWQKSDEILVMENDFPANILPWLALEHKGVNVKQILPKNKVLTADELLEHITPKTRLFCISHVHTFTGIILDIERFAQICKDKAVMLVLNLSQSIGAMPVDISQLHVDAVVTAGYKWLLGPYGTGFAWINPSLRERLEWNHSYWPTMLSEEELQSEGPLKLKKITSARKFDQFGTANFFNFVPFQTSIDYLLGISLENVAKHNSKLVDQFVGGLDRDRYNLISPEARNSRSSLIVISHKERDRNREIFKQLLKQGIYLALWKGYIRIAPHLYNTSGQIKRVLEALNKASF